MIILTKGEKDLTFENFKLNGKCVPALIENLILDIDNCVFDSREWEKYVPKENTREGWDNYHNHYFLITTNNEMIDFIDKLSKQTFPLKNIYFITAREDIKNMRDITIEQLNSAFGNLKCWKKINKYLYMRNACDYSPTYIVKNNILNTHILAKTKIDLAIDDDIKNINMYRENGIISLHYAKYCS